MTKMSSKPSWVKSSTHLWMCGASNAEDKNEEEPKFDDAYILDPFPDHKFVRDAWMDILATVDMCVNKVNPITFCDEEGYDIASFQMINVIPEKTIVETKSRIVQLEQSRPKNGFSSKPSIYAIQEIYTQLTTTRPCILVEIGLTFRTELPCLTQERISMP